MTDLFADLVPFKQTPEQIEDSYARVHGAALTLADIEEIQRQGQKLRDTLPHVKRDVRRLRIHEQIAATDAQVEVTLRGGRELDRDAYLEEAATRKRTIGSLDRVHLIESDTSTDATAWLGEDWFGTQTWDVVEVVHGHSDDGKTGIVDRPELL